MLVPDHEMNWWMWENTLYFLFVSWRKRLWENFLMPMLWALVMSILSPCLSSKMFQAKSRRVYITFRRILAIGSTPGCRGCEGDSSNHNNGCIARFWTSIWKSINSGSRRRWAILSRSWWHHSWIEDPDEYTPSFAPSHEMDVPEFPPRDSAEASEDCFHDVEQGVGAIVSIASGFKFAIRDERIHAVMNSVLPPSKHAVKLPLRFCKDARIYWRPTFVIWKWCAIWTLLWQQFQFISKGWWIRGCSSCEVEPRDDRFIRPTSNGSALWPSQCTSRMQFAW